MPKTEYRSAVRSRKLIRDALGDLLQEKFQCTQCGRLTEKHQHCHGWVRVNAEKKISSVFEALKNGAFYSSTGPEIYDFYMEDGTAHIKCSPVKWIKFHVGTRPLRLQKNENGLITEASIKIPDTAAFVRVTVEDEKGMRAWTNPFFMR